MSLEPLPEDPTWLPERLERAKKSAVQGLLADLGYEDAESLKTTLSSQAEQLAHLTTAQASLSEQVTAAQTARQQAYLDASFITTAAPYRFINLDEARLLLDWEQVHLDEENRVVGMTEALTALVQARPHLVRRIAAPQTDSGARTASQPKPAHVADFSPAQVEDLKRRFKLW